ncbi:pancreatic triacylglycerol lipase-like isoform X4 [Frankliniella occidentalis]|uniref:Pancreatic triacylglycerol lipase-like isoform X4 n=1 Tax=Frankliniella occidentalis TaxID=133901 RepID=A0A9C6XTN4_FRAOC|nr:pancreatic triacylglycerol lipase-like isoform X4 [Frankliniella occidentalis]
MVKAAVAVELLGAGLLLVATAASCKPPSCNPSGRRLARPSATPSLGMSATVKSPSASAQTDTPISAASLYAIFYLPNGSNWSFPLSQGDALHSHPDFDADKNATVFFVPGYTVKPTAEGVRLAIKAFTTKHESFNFLLLDWTLYSGRPYVAAAMNMGQVAELLAAWLERLRAGGLAAARMWLVGQSLGAHLAGKAAAAMAVRPARVTGLDPARPLFWFGSPLTRLDRRQATFVDVIHTDGSWRGIGVRANIGHQDFWPNYGAERQPGCHSGW